jgi:hypothetical protein
VARLRAVFGAVEARFEGSVTWRGGAIDRLLDERHAVLVGETAERLRRIGWNVEIEVTFNAYGDRGAIDILATRAAERVALVVEIKTELTAIDEMLRRLDVKERLAPAIVGDRLGWRPATVGRLVVLLETSTNRRRVAVHARVLDLALPARGVATRTWLREPVGRLSGLLISSSSNGRAARRQANPSVQPRSTRPVG